MAEEVVVGVYLERSGGAVMRAVTGEADASGMKSVQPTNINMFEWDPNDVDGAVREVQRMAALAADMGRDNLRSVAIASYGPFLSLKRSNLDGKFGVIHPKASHLPLQGLNLRALFYNGLVQHRGKREAFITIHTDAEACAIGEAMARGLPERHVLAFILVTEGVGLGIVQGRRPLASALHSEIGMLHVRYDRNDPLKPKKDSNLYARSLSEMAENGALRRRYMLDNKVDAVTDAELLAARNDAIWDLRAYYLAQACLACAVILAPHQIVLGADLDFDRSIAERTNRIFRSFLDARRVKDQPVFEFEELDRAGYISRSEPIPEIHPTASFRVTGALGMCQAAANAGYGADHGNEKVRS